MNTCVKICVETADSFRELAHPYFSSHNNISNFSGVNPLNDIGIMTTSAICLSLALEMYIESILTAVGDTPPKTHDVYKQYLRLPNNIRKSVEIKYQNALNQYRNDNNDGETAIIDNCIRSNLAAEDVVEKEKSKHEAELQDHSMRAILQRASESFTTWRYFFALRETETITFFTYEYCYLNIICSILRDEIDSLNVL